MTTQEISASVRSVAVQQRISQLEFLFDELQKGINRQLDFFGAGHIKFGRDSVRAMGELHQILILLSRAEEAFHEDFRTFEPGDDLDIRALRDHIGSKLDHIRLAKGAGGIPEEADSR